LNERKGLDKVRAFLRPARVFDRAKRGPFRRSDRGRLWL